MSQKLISHNKDLKKLRDEGFEVEIIDSYLVVGNIPYVDSSKEIKYGVLVSDLDLSGDKTTRPKSHVTYFKGDNPCHKDGSPINIVNSQPNKKISEKLIVNLSFSSKPPVGFYDDYFHKMTTYAEIISSQAKALDSLVTPKTFKVIEENKDDSVFNYLDTNSSRAEINLLADKYKKMKIAIIGLGGTGSYVLDFVSKTPVKEIHLFDKDYFFSHNAFRTPGAASIEELNAEPNKVEYLKNKYSSMHRNIIAHSSHIHDSNLDELSKMSFVFICIDKGAIKASIFEYLQEQDIPYIDTGMDVKLVENQLIGTIRVTTGTKEKNDHIGRRVSLADDEDDEYSQNIQIAELNAFNASLAVIKWKKLIGYYQDQEHEFHSTYDINVNLLLDEEKDEENDS